MKRSLADLEEMAKLIGGFVLLVLVITAIHSLLSLPLSYGIVMRKNPYKYQFKMAEVSKCCFIFKSFGICVSITISEQNYSYFIKNRKYLKFAVNSNNQTLTFICDPSYRH